MIRNQIKYFITEDEIKELVDFLSTSSEKGAGKLLAKVLNLKVKQRTGIAIETK